MRPPVEQRVGAVLDALYAAWDQFDGVSVSDGPFAQQVVRKDALSIGDDQNESIHVTTVKQPGLAVNYLETITVICTLRSWSGSDAMKPRRDRCVAILALIRNQLGSDVTLGGACDEATLGVVGSWKQDRDSDGATVTVKFTVMAKTSI